MTSEKLRIDKYLWAIRLFKTRTQASHAIDSGKVTSLENAIKACKHVSIGDRYEVKTEGRKWIIEVTALLDHRVPYSEAVNYYVDLTPVEELVHKQPSSFVEYTGKRLSRQGRPTKRNRREIDKWKE